MKTVLDYLSEKKDMTWHNRLCYSKTYSMDTPRDGEDDNFWECVRDCEIVEYLIELVKHTPTKTDSADKQQSQDKILTYGATSEEIRIAQIDAKLAEAGIPQSIYIDIDRQEMYCQIKQEIIDRNILQIKHSRLIFVEENLGDINLDIANSRNKIIRHIKSICV